MTEMKIYLLQAHRPFEDRFPHSKWQRFSHGDVVPIQRKKRRKLVKENA
jgi:hypothetical protein